jgi:ribosome-associated heat shock protein Hsp15
LSGGSAVSQRLDRWLWHARIVKTRALAAGLVASGYVRINGRRAEQPSRAIKAGDVLTIALPSRVRVLKVAGILPRRADAAAARRLYEALTPQA